MIGVINVAANTFKYQPDHFLIFSTILTPTELTLCCLLATAQILNSQAFFGVNRNPLSHLKTKLSTATLPEKNNNDETFFLKLSNLTCQTSIL